MRKFLISLIIILIFLPTSIRAANDDITIDTDITSNEFLTTFNPSKDLENDGTKQTAQPFVELFVKIANAALSIVQFIGAIATVISIALYGVNNIFGVSPELRGDIMGHMEMSKNSPYSKIELKRFFRRVIIGSILLFFGGTFVKLMIGLLM